MLYTADCIAAVPYLARLLPCLIGASSCIEDDAIPIAAPILRDPFAIGGFHFVDSASFLPTVQFPKTRKVWFK